MCHQQRGWQRQQGKVQVQARRCSAPQPYWSRQSSGRSSGWRRLRGRRGPAAAPAPSRPLWRSMRRAPPAPAAVGQAAGSLGGPQAPASVPPPSARSAPAPRHVPLRGWSYPWRRRQPSGMPQPRQLQPGPPQGPGTMRTTRHSMWRPPGSIANDRRAARSTIGATHPQHRFRSLPPQQRSPSRVRGQCGAASSTALAPHQADSLLPAPPAVKRPAGRSCASPCAPGPAAALRAARNAAARLRPAA